MGERPGGSESNNPEKQEKDILRQAEDLLGREPQDNVDVMIQEQLRKVMARNWPERIKKQNISSIMGEYYKLKDSQRESQSKIEKLNEGIAESERASRQAAREFYKISDEIKKQTGRKFWPPE